MCSRQKFLLFDNFPEGWKDREIYSRQMEPTGSLLENLYEYLKGHLDL